MEGISRELDKLVNVFLRNKEFAESITQLLTRICKKNAMLQ